MKMGYPSFENWQCTNTPYLVSSTERIRRYERRDSGSIPLRGANFYIGLAE